MALYLLHLEPRYRHAGHYLGFTEEADVTRRVNEHLTGSAKASPLITAALQAGCRVSVARTWTGKGADRTYERKIKDGGQIPAYRPHCRARRKAANAPPDPLDPIAVTPEGTR